MLNVQIIQPVIPAYRVSFFERLFNDKNINVIVCSGLIEPGGVRSCNTLDSKYDLKHDMVAYFRGKIQLQKKLTLDKRLVRGDVLVVCGNPRFLSNFPLILRAQLRGVAVVWWGHGWTSGRRGLLSKVRQQIMKIADVLLLYTDKEVEGYKLLGFDENKLFATNNTIDTDKAFKQLNLISSKQLNEFKIQNEIQDKKVLLFCGRLSEKSAIKLLIEALLSSEFDNENILLVVIGSGELKASMREYAKSLGLDDIILWKGEIYEEEELAYWFLSSYVFIYPGSIGLSLLHSFCYGLPVITHDNFNNQMPEISALKAGRNGLLFNENDVQDLAKVISRLLCDPKMREMLSKNALSTVYNEYTIESMVDRFMDAIKAASAMK